MKNLFSSQLRKLSFWRLRTSKQNEVRYKIATTQYQFSVRVRPEATTTRRYRVAVTEVISIKTSPIVICSNEQVPSMRSMHMPNRLAGVNRDDPLKRARRIAQRSRAALACMPCKASKVRCSDHRPCSRCMKTGAEFCVDPQSTPQTVLFDTTRKLTSICTFDRLIGSETDAAYYSNQLFPMTEFSLVPNSFTISQPANLFYEIDTESNHTEPEQVAPPWESNGGTPTQFERLANQVHDSG